MWTKEDAVLEAGRAGRCRGLVVALMLVALVVSLPEASQAKKANKVTRVESDAYDVGSYRVQEENPLESCGSPKVGCTEFKALRGERFVEVVIQDTARLPVVGEVIANGKKIAMFCGTMDLPVRIPPNAQITVVAKTNVMPIYACGAGTAYPTSGEVTATFSNVP